jgi:AbrB family looped-hinge helix DNA binding protein
VYNDNLIDIKMTTITVSPKFQIVIPREIREALGILPGQKLRAVALGNRIEYVPVRTLKSSRGMLSGISTAVPREADRI